MTVVIWTVGASQMFRNDISRSLIYQFVLNIPEGTLFILVLYLYICESSLVLGAEVNKLFATVNHAVIPHSLKSSVNAVDYIFI